MFTAALPAVLTVLFLLGVRSGGFAAIARHPLWVIAGATVAGSGYRALGGPIPPADAVHLAAQFGLGLLVFLAAQQCRLSRLAAVSPSAFRLALFYPPTATAILAVTILILLPETGLWSAVMVAAAMALGGGRSGSRHLLTAPVEAATIRSARLEGAAALVLFLPIIQILAIGMDVPPAHTPLHLTPLFLGLAGFAVGGTMGLLAGRLIRPAAQASLPVMPFLIALAIWLTAFALGFDPVLACAGGGLLYSENTRLAGAVRARLWRSGEAVVSPAALAGVGFLLAPMIWPAGFFIILTAVLAITAVKAAPRAAILSLGDLLPKDRSFLIWYGGAPGAAAALFLISVLNMPGTVLEDAALKVGAAILLGGMVLNQVSAKPLISRLAHETARARRRRFTPA